jgi:putative transposase
MPRIARIAPKGQIFHILTRGNNRQDIFKDELDYRKYLEILEQYKEKHHFKIYHYVLMKNHVHLVLETKEEGGSLAEIMKGINLSYAQYYKKRYDHVGHFWQDRYKSILVSKDKYLLACGSYVELNPVRAGVVSDPREYRWSSYRAYAYGKKDLLVDEHGIYKEWFKGGSKGKKKYREFVRGMLQSKGAMRGEMERRVVYGSEVFVDKVKKVYELDEIIRPVGRPKAEQKDEK